MVKSKLVKILKSLSKEEMKYLGWFVKSDYFNTDENLVVFYEYLKRYYPGFDSTKFTKEVVFQHIFTKDSYDDAKMRNLMSKMTQLLEEYLVCLEWKQDKFVRDKLLIDAFERRNIDFDEFKKLTNGLIGEIGSLPFRDEDYFLLNMELQKKLYYQSTAIGANGTDKIIEDASDCLNNFYSLSRLKMMNEISSLMASKSIAKSIKKNKEFDENNILLKIYNNIAELYEQKSEAIYFATKTVFLSNINEIRRSEQKFVIKYLLEFAIREVRSDSKYLREIFELYKIAHENEILENYGIISNATFVNIVMAASVIGEFAWCRLFLAECQVKIESKTRKEMIALGEGFVAFYNKNYSTVIDLISNLNFKGVLYQLLAKSLSLKSYFELFLLDNSYFSFVKSYSESFEKYVSRNPDIGSRKSSSYTSYVKFVRKLAGLIHQSELSVDRKKLLIKELNGKGEIAEMNWLRTKIEGN